MDLVFNELSVQPLAIDKTKAFERVNDLISTFKRGKEFNFNKIRFHTGFESIELADSYSLNDFCNEPQNRTKSTLLRGLFKYPFIDDDSEEADRYIQNYFQLQKGDTLLNPYGLASAYLYSTSGIGFGSEPFWENCQFELLILGDEETTKTVFCVSKPEHLDSTDFRIWNEEQIINSLEPDKTLVRLFPNYIIEPKAIDDILFWKHDALITGRLVLLFKDITINPFIGGLGKTESLKGRINTYSKRVDDGNRIVYKVEANFKITILSCRGHYSD